MARSSTALEAQVTQAVRNIASLLEGEGSGLAEVVKTTVFLTDMADFGCDERLPTLPLSATIGRREALLP